jgi:hypothetical protein
MAASLGNDQKIKEDAEVILKKFKYGVLPNSVVVEAVKNANAILTHKPVGNVAEEIELDIEEMKENVARIKRKQRKPSTTDKVKRKNTATPVKDSKSLTPSEALQQKVEQLLDTETEESSVDSSEEDANKLLYEAIAVTVPVKPVKKTKIMIKKKKEKEVKLKRIKKKLISDGPAINNPTSMVLQIEEDLSSPEPVMSDEELESPVISSDEVMETYNDDGSEQFVFKKEKKEKERDLIAKHLELLNNIVIDSIREFMSEADKEEALKYARIMARKEGVATLTFRGKAAKEASTTDRCVKTVYGRCGIT